MKQKKINRLSHVGKTPYEKEAYGKFLSSKFVLDKTEDDPIDIFEAKARQTAQKKVFANYFKINNLDAIFVPGAPTTALTIALGSDALSPIYGPCYGVAAFNINFASIGMVGTDSYFSGTADNVMVVIPEANNAWSEGADINGDGIVDVKDFAIMAKHWLERNPNPMVWVFINDPGVSGHESFAGYMSKYETTNAQYCQFLNTALASGDITVSSNRVYGANGSNGGADFVGQLYFDTSDYTSYSQITWNGTSFSVRSRDGYDMSNHPVVMVSWYGATAFCNYYGYRLPTEWEWQAVADYDGSFTYGCGTTINSSKANYEFNNPLGLSSYPYTSPVNHYPSYGYGMNDMAGNVWEWTDSCYYGDCEPDYRVIRGNCWDGYGLNCTVSYRFYSNPNGAGALVGFRVCR